MDGDCVIFIGVVGVIVRGSTALIKVVTPSEKDMIGEKEVQRQEYKVSENKEFHGVKSE